MDYSITQQKHQSGCSTQSALYIFNTLRIFIKEPIREQDATLECMNAYQGDGDFSSQSKAKPHPVFFGKCWIHTLIPTKGTLTIVQIKKIEYCGWPTEKQVAISGWPPKSLVVT